MTLKAGCGRVVSAAIVVVLILSGGAAAAQTPASAPAAADANITPYAPAYFAEYRPVTALDMIGRIPGFQFDGGTSARGFAGTAGNVLIDGQLGYITNFSALGSQLVCLFFI